MPTRLPESYWRGPRPEEVGTGEATVNCTSLTLVYLCGQVGSGGSFFSVSIIVGVKVTRPCVHKPQRLTAKRAEAE